jgi:hypothetical protein
LGKQWPLEEATVREPASSSKRGREGKFHAAATAKCRPVAAGGENMNRERRRG